MKNSLCPCGRDSSYSNCCGKVHLDLSNATTAEDLMRSRYTAFTQGNGDFLMKSHHSSTRVDSDKEAIVAWAKAVKWIKLDVLKTKKGKENDAKGTVEFKAFYNENGKEECIHENSEFVREDDNWVYLGRV